MRFTRRRWDYWCLGGALFLSLGGLVECGLERRFTPRALVYPAAALILLPPRFWIPAQGTEYPSIRSLPRAHRFFIAWQVASLALWLGALPFIARSSRPDWRIWPWVSLVHFAVTLGIAHRVDRSRRSIR